MPEIIKLISVNHFYGSGSDKQRTLENLDFSVSEGEFLCILGPSGCGKSTLLNLLVGFITPTSGEIIVPHRNHIGDNPFADIKVVMQHANLFPWLNVLRNISFGLRMRGEGRARCKERVSELLDLVGLPGIEDKYPNQLSGGMQQRVAIARALAPDPKILLMDEPFGALDAQMRRRMQSEIIRIWRITGKTIIFVTHDISESVLLADRIVVLTRSPGQVKKIVSIDTPHPRERDRNIYDKVFELEQML